MAKANKSDRLPQPRDRGYGRKTAVPEEEAKHDRQDRRVPPPFHRKHGGLVRRGDRGSLCPARERRRQAVDRLVGPLGPRRHRSHPQARRGMGGEGEGRRERKSVEKGKSVSVSVDLGGRRIIKKNKIYEDKKL